MLGLKSFNYPVNTKRRNSALEFELQKTPATAKKCFCIIVSPKKVKLKHCRLHSSSIKLTHHCGSGVKVLAAKASARGFKPQRLQLCSRLIDPRNCSEQSANVILQP